MARGKKGERKKMHYSKVRKENQSIPDDLLKTLVKQRYHIVGEHSAAKMCHWTGSALTCKEWCYKNKFYGIPTHRCLQCTPVLLFCNHACVFCWRIMPEKKMKFEDMPKEGFAWEEPNEIVEGLIDAQKKIISGFGGNKKTPRKLYEEAMDPSQATLSLTGEPTMYPKIEGMLAEFHKREMTTFLVTNGTFPERIAQWKTLPTQFYVSMVAPNEEAYRKYIRPASAGLWEKYLQTLGLMPELGERTRTVLRMTLARGVNDSDLEGYARQILIAKPHYVEVKSMVFVGGARQEGRGLSLDSMLKMEEIEKIAGELASLTGYIVSDRHALSRVVLLCRDKETEAKRKIGVN